MLVRPHGMRTWRFSWSFRRIHRIFNRAPDSSFSIFLAKTAPGGKLASVTATASFPNLSLMESVDAFQRSTVKSLPFEVLIPHEVMPELFCRVNEVSRV